MYSELALSCYIFCASSSVTLLRENEHLFDRYRSHCKINSDKCHNVITKDYIETSSPKKWLTYKIICMY